MQMGRTGPTGRLLLSLPLYPSRTYLPYCNQVSLSLCLSLSLSPHQKHFISEKITPKFLSEKFLGKKSVSVFVVVVCREVKIRVEHKSVTTTTTTNVANYISSFFVDSVFFTFSFVRTPSSIALRRSGLPLLIHPPSPPSSPLVKLR